MATKSKSLKKKKVAQSNKSQNIFKTPVAFSRNQLFVVIAVILVVGGFVVWRVLAATPTDTEPETWSASGGTVKTVNDASASAGAYITFQATTPPTQTPNTDFSTAPGRAIPDTLYGVTTESVENLSGLNTSLTKHTKRPMTRIVFQSGTNPSSYTSAVNTLRNTSYIMGEIMDSDGLKKISTANYRTRAANFVNTFKNNIDIYEIGNELNGEWAGTQASTLAQLQAAYDVVEKDNASLNLKSAITLNFWPNSGFYENPWENTETYAKSIPAEIRNGVDYVLLSFYETALDDKKTPSIESYTPASSEFVSMFNKFKTIFPNAKLGMGEIGAQGTDDDLPRDATFTEKQTIANRYYGMHNTLKTAIGPRYVGGYFWWYYYQDAVPYNRSQSVWPTIEQNFNSY
jgi:hypothetical protein